jgi:hypothetical protein
MVVDADGGGNEEGKLRISVNSPQTDRNLLQNRLVLWNRLEIQCFMRTRDDLMLTCH